MAIRNYDHYEYLDHNVNNLLTGYEPGFSVFTFSESSTEFTVFWSNNEPPAWPGEGQKIYTDTFTLSQNTLVSQNGPTNVFDNSWENEGVQVSTRNLRIVEDPSGDGKIVIFQSTDDSTMQAHSGPYLHIAYLDQSQTPPVLSKPIPVLDENKYSINGTFQSTQDVNDSQHYEEPVGYKINIVDHNSDVIALGNGRFAVAYSTTDNYENFDFKQGTGWTDWGEQERPSTGIFVQTFKLTKSALVPEGGPIQYTNVFEDLAETSDSEVYHQYPDLTADGTGGYNLIYSVSHYNADLPPDDSEVKFLEGRSTPKTNVTIDSISDDTGSANNDFITQDDDGLTINATLSTQLASGETLEYSADNGATWSDISSAVSGTAITHTDASLTSDATIQMRVTDSAGNSSIPVERTIDVDTEAPKAPELNQVTGDNIINASEAEDGFDITGTGEPGATITLAGPTLAGGNTAIVQNDGTWSIPVTKADVTAMGEGNTNLSLTQTDSAGNISDPTTQSITVDALPAILSADMSFGEVLTPDEMDEQADLTVKTANIEDGATISISIDGVSMTPVSATIEANKAVFSASAEELQSLRDGTYEFTLTVTDFPSVQKVQSFKKTGDIDGTENDDTITPTSGPNNTPYADGDGDNVDGGDGTDDYIDAKGGNDIVDGGQGNDIIHGGTGNDILNGGVGDDTLDGGSGNDLLRGDTGNDSLKGGDGQDDLQGGDGDDSLDGGDGNDVLDGGTGADTLTGGAGRDEFKVEAGDTVTDFDIEEDKIDLDDIYNFDTLALWNAENPNNSFSTPLQWLKSDQADGDGLAGLNQNGVPINLMNDGAFINASDLTQTNTGVVCYGAKTRIETIDGLVEIDRLQPGDLVKTGGNGHHPIRWIRGRTIFHAELQAHPNLVPVRIKAGAMGKGLPKRDLIISQHHRMIVSSDLSSAETGSKEIFIAAKDLIGVPGIEIAIDLTEITYWHFICDQHQVVFAEGAASESLYTGPEALKMLGAEARAEIYQIFPELRDAPPHYAPKPARPILTQAESKSLIFQHYRSRTALCRQNSDAGMRPV